MEIGALPVGFPPHLALRQVVNINMNVVRDWHAALLLAFILCSTNRAQEFRLDVEQITHGERHHFFGYIGQSLTCPWNKSERYILALRTDFHDRMPRPDDAAEIVLIDTRNRNETRVIDRTRAWNFQQGTMFYWNPIKPETQFFFNDRDLATQHVYTVLYDIEEGRRIREYRFNDVPVANGGVSPTGEFFLAINYARMARLRPVTGYPGLHDPTEDVNAPKDDGVFRVDISSGRRQLLVSFQQLRELLRDNFDNIDAAGFYINHSLCSRTGKHVYFFARANQGFNWKYVNVPCSVSTEGDDLKSQMFIGGHPEWDEGTVVIGAIGKRQMRYDILQQKIVGQIGNEGDFPNPEGDISLAPDGNWFANGYALPGGKLNAYLLMRRSDGLLLRSNTFSRGPYTGGDLRIDQAPSWNRSNSAILVSGMTAEGTRQLFIVKVVPANKP